MRLTKQCTRLAVIFLAVIFALPSHETWAEDKVITVSVSILPQAFFVEKIDEANRARYEVAYDDVDTKVTVQPVFVEIGEEEGA